MSKTNYVYSGRPTLLDCRLNKEEERLEISLDDGRVLYVYDDDEQCCEKRSIHTDDGLKSFLGQRLVSIGIREQWSKEIVDDENEVDCAFVHVKTTGGTITLNTYNKHNGYYSGFDLCVEERR
jgi:hypothetical protein